MRQYYFQRPVYANYRWFTEKCLLPNRAPDTFHGMVFQEKQTVTFTHYFKQTNSFYEFILCPASQKHTLDVFAVDITARKDAENTLREINKKLEMTLGIARIIPWRWDLKEGLIYCEAQKILDHMNFTKEKNSTVQVDIIKASEYFRKIHPEDFERMHHVHEISFQASCSISKKNIVSSPK